MAFSATFTSAAKPIPADVTFMRGLASWNGANLGNFWVDLTRTVYRVFLPLPSGLVVWQGTQTLNGYATATTLESTAQRIAPGPVTLLKSIKHLCMNGGEFFSMNAAHPFENPTPLTNELHILDGLQSIPTHVGNTRR